MEADHAKLERRVKVLQFGEGNFLRAFFDWMIEMSNRQGVTDLSVAVVSPRFRNNDAIKALRRQKGVYHVWLEGMEAGKPVRRSSTVTCVADAFSPEDEPERYLTYVNSPDLRFVVSNTTEAGIRYEYVEKCSLLSPTFPGKITAMLYERFSHFGGEPSRGLIFLCCELIEDNGKRLRECVLRHSRDWNLGADFETWVMNSCHFCDTLVDRIVSGYPVDSIDAADDPAEKEDALLVKGELYHLWVIGGEGAETVREELPLDKAGLNVAYLPEIKDFRERKVRILNGSHTGMVAIALQLGCETVLDAFSNPKINLFIRQMMKREVLPEIEGDPDELQRFANSILERFYNPYIRHMLKSIALNSLSKWETRNFPTVRDFWRNEHRLADYELFTFAALLNLYAPGSDFIPDDDRKAKQTISECLKTENSGDSVENISESVERIVGSGIFKENFEVVVPGFSKRVAEYMVLIRSKGMEQALDVFLKDHRDR